MPVIAASPTAGRTDVQLSARTWNFMTDFSSSAPPLQAATYTVKAVVSKKWCEIDTLLLHTTNRKYNMAYLFVPSPMTLDDVERHSPQKQDPDAGNSPVQGGTMSNNQPSKSADRNSHEQEKRRTKPRSMQRRRWPDK